MSTKKQKAYKKGHTAETLAAWLLRVKGYSILARREKTPVGEIDLIARRGKLLIFVEVKARTCETAAAEAITPKNRDRVIRAAQYYIGNRPALAGYTMRFDAILLSSNGFPRHVKDAWQTGAQFGIV